MVATAIQYLGITLMVIFVGLPMLVAELITQRTIRWKSSLRLFAWCVTFWLVVGAFFVTGLWLV
jgi:hypothetical protein